MTEITHLPLAAVVPDPDQPRKRFGQAELDELAASIESTGLLQPIVVRPVDDHYVIVAGERRYRAHVQLGRESIDCIVRDVEGAAAFELSMIENVIRANMNPVEEAAGYQKLLDAGATVADLAERLGKPAASIQARLALLKLDAPIRQLVAVGQVDGFVAGHLARLSTEGQHRAVRALTASPMGPLDAARLCTAIAAQESTISAFDDFMVAPAVATFTSPFEGPVVDRREAELEAAIARAVAALDEALALVGQNVAGDLDGIDQAAAAAVAIQKEHRRRRAAAIAKSAR